MEVKADYLVGRCAEVVIPRLKNVISSARQAGLRIVHTRLASRHPDYLDIVPAHRAAARFAGAQDGSTACDPRRQS